ncbi:PKD domain-containing protein [Flavobacterium sp. LaA7.5]|nr:PKD domain-containing protein [Flavobacterium salilacus subsp. altitudinum]
MKHLFKIKSHLFTIALITAAWCGKLSAQDVNVQFIVNMNYQVELGNFNPGTQSIDIAGTFNDWGANPTVLADADTDGIYTTTVSLPVGSNIQFKTRIDGQWNGTEEFSGGGPNRNYTVTPNGVVEYWYNNELPPNLLNVIIATSAPVVQPGEVIQLTDQSSGNPVAWSWIFPGGSPETSDAQNPIVTYAEPGNHDVTLTITNGDGETATNTFENFIRVDAMATQWWNDCVFYEVFVRSFKDSNGDGKGDLQGLIDQLDYLNDGNPETTTDLGITGIWLMPIQQSPSYHGYDVTDYMAVESDYGNNALFTEFMEAAHARGIKVIIDLVMNHTSSQHPWFIESKTVGSDKRDWYIWEDSPGAPGPFSNNAWHSFNGYYYYGAFWDGMPDLNFYNPDVHEAFEDIAEFWLTDMQVDGFRLDAVKFLHENGTAVQNTPETIAYWQEFRSFYKSVNPEAFAVGEAWDLTEIASQYVNNNGLDYCFEFETADAILNALNSGNAADLDHQLIDNMQSYPFLQFGTMLSNHDTNRVMSTLGSDMPKAKAAATLLLTLPGIPYIYYGEEIGMTGIKPDPNIRTPMQWNSNTGAGFTTGSAWQSINGDYTTKNVAAQQADNNSLWHHYKSLISIRNNENALRRGNYRPVTSTSTSVVSFMRQYDDENIIVVANVGSTQQQVTLSLPYAGLIPGNHILNEMLGGTPQLITIGSTGGFAQFIITVPARGVYVYKMDNALITDNGDLAKTVLYPNPATNQFTITTATGKVALYTLTGQLVKTYSGHEANYNYDVNGLNSGIYLVKVTDTNNNESTVKLIIQ